MSPVRHLQPDCNMAPLYAGKPGISGGRCKGYYKRGSDER